ncbi:TonB-dependent siderophore receptor [Verticiella sediminum]|uniref:TonB-dependent siderophore receptor n=1 Tax=Verticiella sediminum TaxID=1247510 RepID=A0A556ATY6_9BURK|nr:TonB-dependent receptor [Verticiella sediminum]TSH96399.1 TonB-dependent siderophore receptor [Verticiella sediminum]
MRHVPPRFRPAPLALAIALTLGAPAIVQAQAAADGAGAITLSIAAQPLGSALNELSAATGTPIGFSPALVAGKTALSVNGALTVGQAVEQLLAGSGLIAVQEGSGIVIKPAPMGATVMLTPITVTAARDGTTEDTGSYAQTGPSRTATGLNLSLRETPQSVTVMTRQRMDDFKLQTLTDVMEQTPGLTVDHQGDGNNFLVRGDNVNLQVDGLRQMASGWYANTQMLYTMDDMAEIDRIEVLKGSSGLMNGDGKYGATINMIRKRPTHDFRASIGAGAGSWDNYRADVDVGGPLNASGTVRGRLVAAAADGKDFRDYTKRRNQTLYGTLDVDLTPDTLLNAGFTYRRREYYGAGSTSMIQAYSADGQYLGLQPRSFNVGAPWSGYEQDTRTVFASLEHRFGNGWTAKLRASDEKTEMPYGETGIWFTGIPEVVDISRAEDHANRNRSVAFDLQGPFQLLGMTHELMIGADTARTSSDTYSANKRLTNPGLDYADGGGAIVRPDDIGSYPVDNHSYFSSRRHSFYAAGRFSLADPVKLIAGARVTNYQQYDLTPYAYSNYDFRRNGVVTPYAGLVVDVHENVSLYGSYASIFKPQSVIDAQGRTLDPEEGKTYEVGAKGEFFDQRLNASIAHFWMKTDNVAESTGEVMPDGTAIYRAVSGVTRRGYELELSGELAPGWQAQGGFVMNDSSLDSTGYIPRNQFKLATTYQFAGALNGLTVGAATRWQSKTSAGPLVQPSFWLVDLMARYRVSRHFSVNLNVRNVLDKAYFAGLRDFGRIQYTWGAPRSVTVGMRYDF